MSLQGNPREPLEITEDYLHLLYCFFRINYNVTINKVVKGHFRLSNLVSLYSYIIYHIISWLCSFWLLQTLVQSPNNKLDFFPLKHVSLSVLLMTSGNGAGRLWNQLTDMLIYLSGRGVGASSQPPVGEIRQTTEWSSSEDGHVQDWQTEWFDGRIGFHVLSGRSCHLRWADLRDA